MRVPLVVMTGFLGAGKTTLVNRLLARRAERQAGGPKWSGPDSLRAAGKIGIIVNELGEVGIDGALLGGESARQIELPGGCVCCVLGDELDKTLLDLVATNPGLEAIVLETTGVAEPLPIAWAAQREPVRDAVRLAAVVTLVDATNFRASRPVTAAVDAQVAYADVLLVTKAHVAGDADTRATIEAAAGIAPKALVRVGSTDEHAAWLEQLLVDPDLEHAATDFRDDHGSHDHSDGHCREGDRHVHGVDSTWLFVERAVDLEELEDQLAELPANYVRIKGIVRDAGGSWYAIHRVGLRVSSEPIVRKADDGLGENGRIVALGSDLASAKIAACLEAAYL